MLIIDEAQNLSAEVLEQLRLLTNLETNERKLLQIILIGQPELRDMLARPELEQLAQRVIARYHLDALTRAETAQYIRHRLAVAGLSRAMPFDAPACSASTLWRAACRGASTCCATAPCSAPMPAASRVDVAIVDKAAAEVLGECKRGARACAAVAPRGRIAAALALGLCSGGAVRCGLGPRCDGRRPSAAAASSGEVNPRCPTSSKR